MAAYVARNKVLGLRHTVNESWYTLDKDILLAFGLIDEDDEYNTGPLERLNRDRKAELNMLGPINNVGGGLGGGGFGGGGQF